MTSKQWAREAMERAVSRGGMELAIESVVDEAVKAAEEATATTLLDFAKAQKR